MCWLGHDLELLLGVWQNNLQGLSRATDSELWVLTYSSSGERQEIIDFTACLKAALKWHWFVSCHERCPKHAVLSYHRKMLLWAHYLNRLIFSYKRFRRLSMVQHWIFSDSENHPLVWLPVRETNAAAAAAGNIHSQPTTAKRPNIYSTYWADSLREGKIKRGGGQEQRQRMACSVPDSERERGWECCASMYYRGGCWD